MIICHGAIMGDGLVVWGEGEPRPSRKSSRSSGVPTYPPDIGSSVLIETLRNSFPLLSAISKPRTFLLEAPSDEKGPFSALALLSGESRLSPAAVIRPFRVTGVLFEGEHLLTLLSCCLGKRLLAPGILLGEDLIFFSRLQGFSASLVARQKFLPGVCEKASGFHAVWDPVLSGEDTGVFLSFVAACPPSSLALLLMDSSGPTGNTSSSVSCRERLLRFVGDRLDSLVRLSMGKSQEKTPRKNLRGMKGQPLHDCWTDALSSADGALPGSPSELREFSAQVAKWRQGARIWTDSPFTFVMRLDEPEEITGKGDSLKWPLRYFLQPLDDPSLLLSPREATGRKAKQFFPRTRGAQDVTTLVLQFLGEAAALSPEVEESLKGAGIPDACLLDTEQVGSFLSNSAPALGEAGFSLLLPAWWSRPDSRPSLRVKVKSSDMKTTGILSLERLVDVDWEVVLGGVALSLGDLSSLAKRKSALVEFRGQWIRVNPEDLHAAMGYLKQKKETKMTLKEIFRVSLGLSDRPLGLSNEPVAASGWVEKVLSELSNLDLARSGSPPGSFQGTLRPYQLQGYSFLTELARWGLGACLADDMGLGKTIQTLAFLQGKRNEGETRPVCLVCPTSLVNNWKKESERFTPAMTSFIHHGADRFRDRDFHDGIAGAALVITSYSLLQRDLEFLKQVDWAGIVLDEAQNIKNPDTRQSRAARALPGSFRLALSGTPVENHLGDLWSIMEFLNPGLLGSREAFRKSFFLPVQTGSDPQAADRLKKIIRPFLLRRVKTDRSIIEDLPEKNEMKVFCSLTAEQATLYKAALSEAEEVLEGKEGIERKGFLLGLLTRLKQVLNHPAQFLKDQSPVGSRSGKVNRLIEMLEEILPSGDKTLIFTQFAEMGTILKSHLTETFGVEVLFLHGGVPKEKRDAMVERFQEPGSGTPIFILSLKAGGTGLNLTQANHVFHFDRWWNPAVENQATDRAFRIGQKKNVQVHQFLCAGTLEERIDEMIEQKKGLAEKMVGSGEGWIANLSDRDLREILRLRSDAVDG